MSSQSTPHDPHSPHRRDERSKRFRSVRDDRARSATLRSLCLLTGLLATLFVAGGCGESGGGSGASDGVTTIATAPVDLAPGQTTALLAWTPSEGEVSGYLVFWSHGNEGLEFLSQVTEPQVQITGEPGDSIRILVVAQGIGDTRSVASPPSPPIRFYPAVDVASAEATTSVQAVTSMMPTQAPASFASAAQTTDSDPSQTEQANSGTESGDATTGADTDTNADTNANTVLLDQAERERLLRSGLRLPFAELSMEASQWIQTFVDAQVGAGVSLAGTGDLDGDALRELVWIDSSGQLFVSDGADTTSIADGATVEALPNSFVEAIRLRSTERFAGLADFDGDGIGDWLIEDVATGDVWILDNASHEALFAQIAAENPDLWLVGHGDFDGDGVDELLWQHTDSSFQLSGPNLDLAVIEWFGPEADAGATSPATPTTLTTNQPLAVADLNGDGRDDLVFRGADGFLKLALSVADSSGLRFQWISGPDATIDGLELIATLDLDQDGRTEIAWWGDAGLEIWDALTGP